ncbi:hypothetical protein BaRGS_00021383 [Batillaria attramentaria]|uniref:Uncharacterized protein n=1 Tax=Batillaria attramentaria TaxID=370345 RepID=A0ABD0KJL1_9CAEN
MFPKRLKYLDAEKHSPKYETEKYDLLDYISFLRHRFFVGHRDEGRCSRRPRSECWSKSGNPRWRRLRRLRQVEFPISKNKRQSIADGRKKKKKKNPDGNNSDNAQWSGSDLSCWLFVSLPSSL